MPTPRFNHLTTLPDWKEANGEPISRTSGARQLLSVARQRAEAIVYAFTALLVLGSWLALGAFVHHQRADVIHDIRVQVRDAQSILASHIDTAYESAETLLKVTNTWLAGKHLAGTPPSLADLGRYLSNLTASDKRAIFIVGVDESNRETDLIGNGRNVATAAGPQLHAVDLTGSASRRLKIGAQRYDAIAGSDVLPITMEANPNPFGIAYLRALLPLRTGEGPFGALLAGVPARIGAIRENGQLLFLWPVTGAKIGQYAPQIRLPGGDEFSPALARVQDFPDLGDAFVSYAAIKEAPLGIFAAISAGYADEQLLDFIWLPCLITALSTMLILAGGFLVGRLIRLNRLEAENTQRALTAAETANEAKRQFLANMSHELRTPLNAIIGFADIMQSELFGPLGKPQYLTYTRDVLQSGQQLLGLIEAILEMARFEGGNVILGDAPVPLGSMLRHTVRTLRQRVASGRLDVHVEATDAILIRMDPFHLRQVLINVIGNAIKYSDPGGKVAIDAELSEDGGLAINITDTGIGIPAEAMNEVLQPFAQAQDTYSRRHGGAGLGLAICRSIMEAYGGSIRLRSEVGVGTTVIIEFPQERVAPATLSAAA